MNIPNNKLKLSLMQFILLIHGCETGLAVLTLPKQLAQYAGTDGWISLILGWIIVTIISICIVRIMAQHPGEHFKDILIRYLGKWAGTIFFILWIIYIVLSALATLLVAVNIIQIWVLPRTPLFLILTLLMFNTFLLLRGGIRLLGRYAVFVFFFTLLMPILLLIPLKDSNVLYLLPVFKEGWRPIMIALKTSVFAFLGFEITFLAYPYLKNKKDAVKGIIAANTITFIFYLLITLSSFICFSPDEIKDYLWPTLMLVKPIQFSFLERMEILFLSFYLFVFSTTFIPYTYFFTDGITKLVNKEKWKVPFLILPLIVVLSLFFHLAFKQVEDFEHFYNLLSFYFAFAFPVLFIIYISVYKRFKKRGNQT
ncbi:endospore germination permease [Paenibacillus larvae]|uniref:Endospore germination permease n=1 Tax=Paenibacillus larvae TaxID=1464 RepID=A0AAP5JSI2_9BACL|nr:endospore germination permease [Paenibacillus larvae]AQR79026.1 spore gernimation protein [Paenibacillus larvae subsp. larvae]AVF23885.1 spore germination protein YndE [Paenibacillus larvae subsp. larvae]ETK29441.1 spore germination protein YndE [Paenibacillus larvae subsp. larvae DSM 25719]MCY7478726.1 endospore germination permease [Paenibacillus larvae]MCY7488312.1 endospore germination permease [Paenibacillus larvae]